MAGLCPSNSSTTAIAATLLVEVSIRHDEQLAVRLGVAVLPVRPGCAVEVDAGRALVLVAERLVQAERTGRGHVDHADAVVAVDAGPGDEVVADRQPSYRLGLVVVAIGGASEVVEGAPVRAAARQ